MEKVQTNLDGLERKLGKANKIAAKGDKMRMGDAIKLARKSQSMSSTMDKAVKEYDSRRMMAQMTHIVALSEEQVDHLIGCQGYLKDKLHVGGLVKRNLQKSA
ncbi:hypothetical protein RB597_002515 [Gaeumannomyces tritici]